MNFIGLPPFLDFVLVAFLALSGLINFALFHSPRINGGEEINAARVVKAASYVVLAGWFGYKLWTLGDLRVPTITAMCLAGIAFADIFAGISKLASVASPPKHKHKQPAPNGAA